ncbi:hypothetical protein ASPZODRAFT_111814 [Penicilliopsis zonata CBS 506.65]|uniref:G domain-containing protein n=1 Tax=Penicilliopsis zonata CBS 506.65 TaxID=1073090 RepID=A0A1L9SPJ9_9EURO|nr:hypothetical protein ASPZODRAFT_111814 [Penicilliopsis zonata CBS 506.65]OJJ49175.1 hypothetical protein ASPZODRAFT_111814 [Penicilliopsis zonata CBS 506.65]
MMLNGGRTVFRGPRPWIPLTKQFCPSPRHGRTFSSLTYLAQSQLSSKRIPGYSQSIRTQQRCLSTKIEASELPPEVIHELLPLCCPGCGAYSQTVEPNEPGYYNLNTRQSRKLIHERKKDLKSIQHQVAEQTVENNTEIANEEVGETTDTDTTPRVPRPSHGVSLAETNAEGGTSDVKKASLQICERCHDLIHHNKGVPAPSPSIDSIGALLDESPHRDNRIFHIVDAADFPMSMIPNIYDALSIQKQRSHNRRSEPTKYRGGKKLPTISFIITRSDLLAATKELVDGKMEYMRTVLREALSKREDFRLGNIHMVSAQRGWWTKTVKEEIREHGGGVWVVGKANVGKSSFIETCFPKDSKNLGNLEKAVQPHRDETHIKEQHASALLDTGGLLPPAPREDRYPMLPTVSSLPGTTVSPIRIPFGRGKGEVIDLPGLDRGSLVNFVREEHQRKLIMTKRKKPEQLTIKPGQSLILGGGLIRITPVDPVGVTLAACFLDLESHVTKTEKALEMVAGQREYPGEVIMAEGAGSEMASAGKFELQWDVTKSYIPRPIQQRMKKSDYEPRPLPYKVMSADILVEGCGWIELTAQVRTKTQTDAEPSFPRVEVFSPQGKSIGYRRPIECFTHIAEKRAMDRRKAGPRGRQSISRKKRILGSQMAAVRSVLNVF